MDMFGRTPEQVEEQKRLNAERTAKYEAEKAAKIEENKKYYAELAAKTNAKTPATAEKKPGFQSGKRYVEYNKVYNFNGIMLKVWNPADLSKKQEAVVHGFIQSLYPMGVNVPEIHTFKKVAPWIDVIFMFNRHEITEATFNSITALHIETSVFDSRNDHNL